jgi:uncharacterized protein YecE (DUF72 family)
MGPVFIGTSGWTYKDWRGPFYPPQLPQRSWLAYYAEHFPTVELNVTTYRLPKQRDITRWLDVPPDFRYTVKLSRLITHRRHPGSTPAYIENYFAAILPLAPRIANVLVQLPPYLERDDAVLDAFLAALPSGYRYVVEFRHPSWYTDKVYALLQARGFSLCLHDLAGSVAPHVVTGPIGYVRLHGPVRAYQGSYRHARLERWAETISSLREDVTETYVYFNNDQRGYAPRNAHTLSAILGAACPTL